MNLFVLGDLCGLLIYQMDIPLKYRTILECLSLDMPRQPKVKFPVLQLFTILKW